MDHTGWLFQFCFFTVFMLSLSLGESYHEKGVYWAPWLGALVNCTAFFLAVHFVPAGDWTPRKVAE